MRIVILTLFMTVGLHLLAQEQRPAYCDELPSTYGNVVVPPGGSPLPPLPRFATEPVKAYKVQVAILRTTDPRDFPFHPTLLARYRPCEQVWVVESRESFTDKKEAEALRKKLIDLGYNGAYITDLIMYQ